GARDFLYERSRANEETANHEHRCNRVFQHILHAGPVEHERCQIQPHEIPRYHHGWPFGSGRSRPEADRSGGSLSHMPLDLGDLHRIDRIVRVAVRDQLGIEPVAMANKWEGGKLVMWPREEGMAAKELPLDTFFHKIVMVRDRLRTLEQRINAHEKLSDMEKVELQQYVTRCYGSLTTFNVLFKDREGAFKGQSKEE